MHPAQHRIKKGKRTNESILDCRENKGKEKNATSLTQRRHLYRWSTTNVSTRVLNFFELIVNVSSDIDGLKKESHYDRLSWVTALPQASAVTDM